MKFFKLKSFAYLHVCSQVHEPFFHVQENTFTYLTCGCPKIIFPKRRQSNFFFFEKLS